MNIIVIGILFIIAFILQYAFTFIQMNSFKKSYVVLRRKGRVVIGRKKGSYRAGSIVMMAIDDDENVIDAEYMQGTTVFARFKRIEDLIGYNIRAIDGDVCDNLHLSKSLKSSVIDGVENFKKLMNGEEIETPKSPFGQLSDKIKIG